MQTVIVTTQYVNPTLFFGKQQMLQGTWCRVQGLGCMVQGEEGARFRVHGAGWKNFNALTNQRINS
jgi:hypothetical protein